jgi:diguanylate cyclase (GGDEF)-like protein
MAFKILLLDDEPGFCGRQNKILIENGYEVIRAQSLADVRLLLDLGRVDLVIHGSHKTHTHRELCQQIRAQYPSLSTLHIDTGNGISNEHSKRGTFHKLTSHLGPERAFLKHVKSLCVFSRLRRSEKVHKATLDEIKFIDHNLSSLDIQELTTAMLTRLGTATGCSNAFWLSPSDVDFYLNEMWKIKSLAGADAFVKPMESRMISLKKYSPEDITKMLLECSRQWGSTWRGARTPQVNGHLMLLPVWDKDENSCVGYFLLVQPNHVQVGLKYWLERFSVALKQSKKYMDAKSLCYVDDVTELYNQRYLGLALDAEIGRAKRNSTPFSVLFMDVDHFKRVNDDKGHMVGSAVLKKISRILKKNIRNFDYGFRYGGDEYMLLLVNTNAEGAKFVGERIRREVAETVFNIDGVELQVTLSIGVASFPEHATTREEIIALADKAMYDGKSKSRNVVFVAS